MINNSDVSLAHYNSLQCEISAGRYAERMEIDRSRALGLAEIPLEDAASYEIYSDETGKQSTIWQWIVRYIEQEMD